jgi:predicted small lipoprotein YifL
MQESDYLSRLRAKISLSRWRNNDSLGKSMKNINLFMTALLFAGVLAGCGKTGPLYRTPEPATVVKPQNAAPNETQSSPEIADSDTKKINASE